MAQGTATFTRDVAPLLYKHCAGCHRPGEVAPFSLLSYEDASRRASLIAAVTGMRYMPPWQPEAGHGEFANARRLTDHEIGTLREWAESGAPLGDISAMPAPPAFTDGWQLGQPGLVARMREPTTVPAEGPDSYRCFVVPLELAADRYVSAIEIRPANRRVVHHALLFQDTAGTARQRDAADAEPGYECFGSPGFLPARGLGGWTPGGFPIRMPEGIPLVLKKGADLVVQLHFHPTGKSEREQAAVGFHFTTTPPVARMMDIPLGSNRIDIPPGEPMYKVRDHFTLPVEVEALGVIPHAHYICKDMKGVAILPDGQRKWMIWIRNWNFNWQEQYRYAIPMRLPAGTRLEMEFTYDNSEANPRNPSHPPQRVSWGMGSHDEMAGLHVQVVPARAEDLEELGKALWGKVMRSLGGGIYRRPQ